MQLKRIEIAGFKTFPEPTELVFGHGVTAIVGPNGCGKSNLTDAVRWVLGEQRPRVLRGGKMEEVIFGGTPRRPALSSAEVTLIIDNSSGGLACDFEEVAITRRLDRSGDSEYRLNRTPCRLKDLTELFMDTGMGSHAYSVIQQGMIDAIISENSDELRNLFEEAAGVSKYKTRKRAALRKLDATERDLVRLTDLKNEVATRTRSLSRQKGKAERYRSLEDELRQLKTVDAGRSYRRRLRARDQLSERHRSAQGRSAGFQAECDAIELEWQTLRLSSDAAEKAAAEASDQHAAALSAWHTNETRRVQLRDRLAFLDTERNSLWERRSALEKRSEELKARRDDARRRCEEIAQRREAVAAQTTQAETAYRNLKEAFAQASGLYRRTEEELAAVNREQAQRASEEAAITERRENRTRLIEDMFGRRTRAHEACEASRQECERLRGILADLETQLEKARTNARDAQAELSAATDERARADNDVRLWEERLREWRAGRDLLAGMIARGEGLGAAAESVLADRDRWQGGVTGLGDRLRPHKGWERAVEIALADRLGALWCRDQETAQAVTAYLVGESVGEAVLLDPSLLLQSDDPRPDHTGPGCAGWLSDKVDCDEDVAPWVFALLGSVMATDSAEAARQAFTALRGRYSCVSRDGYLVETPGTVRIACGARGESVIGRGERLAELDRRIAEGETTEARTRERVVALTGRIKELQSVVDQQAKQVAVLEEQRDRQRLLLEGENARAVEHARVRDELDTDLEKHRQLLSDDETRRSRRRTEDESFQERLARIESRHREASAQVAELEQKLNAAGVTLNDARVRSVEVAAELDAAETECRRLDEMIAENEAEMARVAGRIEGYKTETVGLREELDTIEQTHTGLTETLRTLDEKRAAARAEASRQRETFSAIDIRIKDARRARDDAERARSEVEIELSRLETEMEDFRRHMIETLNIDPLESATDDSPLSDDDLAEQIARVTERINGLGPVNPLALEEYEREKERWDFFEKQIGDLRAAKKELSETIDELNRTAGRRFLETFESARSNFQNVFTELFHGGEADVRLADPADPLESPIEILARPRGKKFIGLRQLSGGERALTALALLFGLYLVKPSPFCILDEVDAPLDDVNCGRFLRLVDRFKGRTQFVIVTHNKQTMEAADVLYGVTMEESGVSKIVSVRLNRVGDETGEPGLAEPRIGIDGNGVPAETETEPVTDE